MKKRAEVGGGIIQPKTTDNLKLMQKANVLPASFVFPNIHNIYNIISEISLRIIYLPQEIWVYQYS